MPLSMFSLAGKWEFLKALKKANKEFPFEALLSLEEPYDDLLTPYHEIVREMFDKSKADVYTTMKETAYSLMCAQKSGHQFVLDYFGDDVVNVMKPLSESEIYLYQTGVLCKEMLMLMVGQWSLGEYNQFKAIEQQEVMDAHEVFTNLVKSQLDTEKFKPFIQFGQMIGRGLPLVFTHPKPAFETIYDVMIAQGIVKEPETRVMNCINKLQVLLGLHNHVAVQQKTEGYQLDNRIPPVDDWRRFTNLDDLELKVLRTTAGVVDKRHHKMTREFDWMFRRQTSNAIALTLRDIIAYTDPEKTSPADYVRQYLMTSDLFNFIEKQPIMNERERAEGISDLIKQTREFITYSVTDDKEWNGHLLAWYNACAQGLHECLTQPQKTPVITRLSTQVLIQRGQILHHLNENKNERIY